MRVPRVLAKRLIVVSRDDYVHVVDQNPELLDDERVTVVPVPLIGRWVEFTALANSELGVGDVLLLDPDDPDRYVTAQEALDKASAARCRLLFGVCSRLGATSLRVVESESHRDEQAWKNDLTGSVSASTGYANKAAAEQKAGFSVGLKGGARGNLRRQIEAKGHWPGGEPDIEAAEEFTEEHPAGAIGDILMLIDQRASPNNPINSYDVTIDFFSELQQHFAAVVAVTRQFSATLGRESLSVHGELDNVFEWNRVVTQQGTFTLRVSFER